MKLVIIDFDGTLAAIRRDPLKVKLSKKMRAALEKLAGNARVIVLSGRPVEFFEKRLPKGIEIKGLHGNAAMPKEGRELFAVVAQEASQLNGIEIEKKPAGAVLHYRRNPKMEKQVGKIALRIKSKTKAIIVKGRKALELMPVGASTKADAVCKIMHGWKGEVFFFGDDDADASAAVEVVKKGGEAFLVVTRERRSNPRQLKKLKTLNDVRKKLLEIAGLQSQN